MDGWKQWSVRLTGLVGGCAGLALVQTPALRAEALSNSVPTATNLVAVGPVYRGFTAPTGSGRMRDGLELSSAALTEACERLREELMETALLMSLEMIGGSGMTPPEVPTTTAEEIPAPPGAPPTEIPPPPAAPPPPDTSPNPPATTSTPPPPPETPTTTPTPPPAPPETPLPPPPPPETPPEPQPPGGTGTPPEEPPPQATPEPGSLVLGGLGLSLASLARWRKRRQAR